MTDERAEDQRREADERMRLRLSVQRALVGATSPSLYGVCATVRNAAITLTFTWRQQRRKTNLKNLKVVGTEVVADFAENVTFEESFYEVTDPGEPLRTGGDWVYLQRGFRTIEG